MKEGGIIVSLCQPMTCLFKNEKSESWLSNLSCKLRGLLAQGRIIIVSPWTVAALDATYWLGINRDKTSHGEWILPKHQGESVKHHSSRDTGKGEGERTKGGKSIITSWMKCFSRANWDPDIALWSTCSRRLHWGTRWDGGKTCPLSCACFRGTAMATTATLWEMTIWTTRWDRGTRQRGRCPGQVRHLPTQQHSACL